MNLFFIAWGNYSGFSASVLCAKVRCGVPVHVVADANPGDLPSGVSFTNVRKLKATNAILSKLLSKHDWNDGGLVSRATSIARWFALRETVSLLKLSYPVFCADWDMVMFEDLDAACQSWRF
jgi:hypothetical protein